jgi:CBS-domain-containing membrane protein
MQKTKVSEICQPCSQANAVSEDDGIEAAIRRFASQPETHVLYVIGKGGQLKGLVKIRHLLNWVRLKIGVGQERHDFTRGVEAFEAFEFLKLAQSTKIGDIVSTAVTVKGEDTLAHALNLMASEEVVEVAVVDKKNKLIGEIKLTDVMARLLDMKKSGGK